MPEVWAAFDMVVDRRHIQGTCRRTSRAIGEAQPAQARTSTMVSSGQRTTSGAISVASSLRTGASFANAAGT
jgi:hypothetical protein